MAFNAAYRTLLVCGRLALAGNRRVSGRFEADFGQAIAGHGGLVVYATVECWAEGTALCYEGGATGLLVVISKLPEWSAIV